LSIIRTNWIKTKTWGLGINFSKTEKKKSNIPNASKLGPEGFDSAFLIRSLPIAIGRGAERNSYLIGTEKAIYDSLF
jgi:hypothetical protein